MNLSTPLNIYIGFDPRERQAYDVARSSMLRHSSESLDIQPLKLRTLKKSILTRPVERKDGKLWCPISEAPMATEFAISRFCIPFLQNKGWALFVDCDIVCQSDVADLFRLADDRYAVMVVKHNQESGPTTKMDGQVQTYYSRKNWSSVVLWNCGHHANKSLTLNSLNTWPGRDLHAFKWLKDEEIGELPQGWNVLVDVTKDYHGPVHIAHYTMGGPWILGWEPRDSDRVWLDEAGNST